MSDNSLLICNALLQTDEELSGTVDGGNSWRLALVKRGARTKLFRQYDEGEQRASMTSQMRNMLRLAADTAGLNDMNDNYCSICVDEEAGRLTVSEISTGDDAIDASWLEPLLAKQDFQAAEGMWWRGTVCDGDAFVMIDPVTLLWSSEPAYDGYSGMVAIYNQMTRKAVWACKIWSESDTKDEAEGGALKTMYLIVYQPDRITYWQGKEGAGEVEPMTQDYDGQSERTWPAELNGALPFVSYANQRTNYTRYGSSEIRKVIPLQDVLNRTLYSMVMASEFAAFPVNISIGMQMDLGGIVPGAVVNLTLKDADGKVISSFTPDQIAFLQACKVTQLPAANIGQYTEQIKSIVQEISQTSQTPLYGITGRSAISADALKQLEIGLVSKCLRFQRQNTDALKELIILTAQMERVFQPGLGTPEITEINVTWKSPEILDVGAQITVLTGMFKVTPGLWADAFYQQKIGQLLGMDKDDITKEILAAAKEKKAKLDAMAALQPTSIFGQGATGNNADQRGSPTGAEAPVNQPDMAQNQTKPMMNKQGVKNG